MLHIDVGERHVTGLRLYLEGKKYNMLAIHLQHLCSLPQILQLHDDPYNHRTPEPLDNKYIEPFGSWKRFSHVYAAPVESDDDSSIVTGAITCEQPWIQESPFSLSQFLKSVQCCTREEP
jgi:hypothetical protein